jgi:hypothetical protein
MIDPTRRIENYNVAITPERVAAQVEPQIADIKTNAAQAMVEMHTTDVQVREVLNGAGVSMIQYPFYLCFGRELWSLYRRGTRGETLAIEAAVLIAKWVARGLTEAVLQAIRTDVFNVSAPIAP